MKKFAFFIAAMVYIVAISAYAEEPDLKDMPPGSVAVAIDRTTSFEFVSKFNDESYNVKVYVPEGKAPDGGFPVIYLLDGDTVFGTYVEALSHESGVKERERAVVVGIDGSSGKNGADRTYDFTSFDLTDYEKKVVVDLGKNPRFGGYDKFLRAIDEEIKPKVEKMSTINKSRSTIYGWSLGGEFVVHTMLTHPDSFACYAAISPALWRSNKMVFSEISDFNRRIGEEGKHVGLFIGVGGLEEELSPGMAQWKIDQEKFSEELKYARMVQNVRDFSSLVAPSFRKHGLMIESKVFDGETHNTMPWTVVNPVIAFALSPTGTGCSSTAARAH